MVGTWGLTVAFMVGIAVGAWAVLTWLLLSALAEPPDLAAGRGAALAPGSGEVEARGDSPDA